MHSLLGLLRTKQALLDALDELAPRVVPRLPEQLVARRNLDDRAHVTPRAHRQHDLPDGHTEQFSVTVFQTDTVVGSICLPQLQFDDQVQPLPLADGGHPEQVFDVQDAQATHLDVMP